MPAEKYSFRLTPAQMTFGAWLLHAAERNFQDCSVLKGEEPPKTEAEIASLSGQRERCASL